MANHHPPHRRRTTNPFHPPRLPQTLLRLAVAVLLILSFAFALLATTIGDPQASDSPGGWVSRSDFTDDPDNPLPTGYRYWRSPSTYCRQSPDGSHSCMRASRPGALCSVAVGSPTNIDRDSPPLCGELALAGRLLVAGCTLLGVAMALALGGLLAAIPARRRKWWRRVRRMGAAREEGGERKEEEGRRRRAVAPGRRLVEAVLRLLLLLTAAAGAGCIAVAELTGGWGLLVWQFPNGEAGVQDNADLLDMWTADSGMTYAAVSWILGGFATLIIVAMGDLPRTIAELEYERVEREELAAEDNI